MDFTKQGYIRLLSLIKDQIIDFHTEGSGIILRHDIDNDLDRSCKMALLEYEMGIKATYFVLNTASYWKYDDPQLFNCLLQFQKDLGHEIGWHNNAITESLFEETPIRDIITRPLEALRNYGIKVTTSAAHGDPQCHLHNYINYNVFGFEAEGWTGYKGEIFDQKEFGLEVEAMHCGRFGYLSDSHGRWNHDPDRTLEAWREEKKRYQILVHPEWWIL